VSNTEVDNYEPVRNLQIADSRYELLLRGRCSCCDRDIYEIWRWSGAIFSRYRMPQGFDVKDFEQFVRDLDQQLLQPAHAMLADFKVELERVNSPEKGIEADFSFSFRLIEYARQRAISLERLGFLDTLQCDTIPNQSDQMAVRAAFEFGYSAALHSMIVNYEDYIHDGIAMSRWRCAGLPKAQRERLRQGQKSRAEILQAARRLYEDDPTLVRNDSETARRIIKLRLPGLQKGNNQQLGLDAITRHLRAARRN
jgi:hypothetical protein